MKILSLFILFITPLWAFKGEEYWNGFQEAYTHGKVRNLYHYLEKLSDLEGEVIPQGMNSVTAIDYRVDSITYFTLTGGKYGFSSTPATPQEWEQHKKALVFSGAFFGLLQEDKAQSLYNRRKLYTNDPLDTKTESYLKECQKIFTGAKTLAAVHKILGEASETNDYEGLRYPYSTYLMELSFCDDNLKQLFDYHTDSQGLIHFIEMKKLPYQTSNLNERKFFSDARQIFNQSFKYSTLTVVHDILMHIKVKKNWDPLMRRLHSKIGDVNSSTSTILNFEFKDLYNMVSRLPRSYSNNVFRKPLLQTMQQKPQQQNTNDFSANTQKESTLDRYLKSFNRDHESAEWFQEALENTFKHFDIGKIFKK